MGLASRATDVYSTFLVIVCSLKPTRSAHGIASFASLHISTFFFSCVPNLTPWSIPVPQTVPGRGSLHPAALAVNQQHDGLIVPGKQDVVTL